MKEGDEMGRGGERGERGRREIWVFFILCLNKFAILVGLKSSRYEAGGDCYEKR